MRELEEVVRTLNEAKAISEWHFRDAVQELLEEVDDEKDDFFNCPENHLSKVSDVLRKNGGAAPV